MPDKSLTRTSDSVLSGTIGNGRQRRGGRPCIAEPLEPRVLLALFMADLTVGVSGTGIDGARYHHGESITAAATIFNEGTAGSGPFHIEFWVSRNGVASRYEFIEGDRVDVGIVPTGSRINLINDGLGYVLPETLPFGDYHITTYVDTTDEVDESDEGNNVGKSNTFRIIGPDLVVRDISVSRVGDLLNATVGIANDGDTLTGSGPFKLKYWLSRKGDPHFRFIEDGSVLSVLQGVPTTDRINNPGWRIPADVPNGEYFITVELDTDGQVKELSETNNTSTSAPFLLGGPDLVVTGISGVGSSYSVGGLLNATVGIANDGDLLPSTGPFKLKYWLSREGDPHFRFIEDGAVVNVLHGVPTSDQINVPGWRIPLDVPQGQYHITVELDTDGDVDESDETNNSGTSPHFSIGVPDLVVTDVDLDQSAYNRAYLLNATATIANISGGSTLPQAPLGFDLAYYLGTADGSDRELYPIQQGSVSFLDPAQSTTDRLNGLGWLIPPTVLPGEYRVWVKADVADRIAESSETNNWGSSQVLTIQGARWEDEAGNPLDLVIPEATPVHLAVYASGVDPGFVIRADIYEDDTLGDDLLEKNVPLSYVETEGGFKFQRRWIPYVTGDGIGGSEYFFSVLGGPVVSLLDSSRNVKVVPNRENFHVLLKEHTVGPGVPLILLHGYGNDTKPNLYEWKTYLNWIEGHPNRPGEPPDYAVTSVDADPADYDEFDVYLYKRDSDKPIGFNGNKTDSQVGGLTDFVYGDLRLGQRGTQYENAKLVLVAHSQGGMLARSFMNRFNPERGQFQGQDVSRLITLGTPHLGSPLAMPDWLAHAMGELYGTDASTRSMLDYVLEEVAAFETPGGINLAWDNSDGVVDGSYPTEYPNVTYQLTPRDTNSVSGFDDETKFYPDFLKRYYGTLDELNDAERFFHKLLTVGAYDNSLADNKVLLDNPKSLITHPNDRDFLIFTTALLARMSGGELGNDNPSTYVASDGLVPLQSALFLQLPPTGASVATLAPDLIVLPNEAQIRSLAHRDALHKIFSSTLVDHDDMLKTSDVGYWRYLTEQVRAVLETVRPAATLADPGDGGGIALAQLNGRGYIDVTFTDAGGSGLDPLSILDEDAEFTISGSAAAGVLFSGAPVRVSDNTYRYAFTGEFVPGTLSVNFIAGSIADNADNLSAGHAESFDVVAAPPEVHSAVFEFETRQAVVYTFSTGVGPSVAAADLLLENLTTGQTVQTTRIAVSYDAATDTAAFTFPGFASGILPDGDYRATLPAGSVHDQYGIPLPDNHVLEFFVLGGDANRDGQVDHIDQDIVRNHWKMTGMTFSQGNFNYDSAVDAADLRILTANLPQRPPGRGPRSPRVPPFAHPSRGRFGGGPFATTPPIGAIRFATFSDPLSTLIDERRRRAEPSGQLRELSDAATKARTLRLRRPDRTS